MLNQHAQPAQPARRSLMTIAVIALVVIFLIAAVLLYSTNIGQSDALYVPNLVENAQQYSGKDITVNGAYLGRGPEVSVLALGVSTLDNGLDAQPLGEQIWLEGFPEQNVKDQLHQPGDAVYGFVRVSGRFEAGGSYGPENKYKYRLQVASVEPIEQVQREEVRIENQVLGDGKVSLFELTDNPGQYNGQKVTTQGYYFWNGQIFVLAEGVSQEVPLDGGTVGSSPQPVGRQIWMEGFPPDKSGELNVGPNNSFVWGKVEVTGEFKSGGGFGRGGAYETFLQVESATPLEQK